MAGAMSESAAEALALKALGYLAGNQDDLARFLAISGIGPADLKQRVGERETLVAVLDHFLAHERLISAFCGDESVSPRDMHLARYKLGGE